MDTGVTVHFSQRQWQSHIARRCLSSGHFNGPLHFGERFFEARQQTPGPDIRPGWTGCTAGGGLRQRPVRRRRLPVTTSSTKLETAGGLVDKI